MTSLKIHKKSKILKKKKKNDIIKYVDIQCINYVNKQYI